MLDLSGIPHVKEVLAVLKNKDGSPLEIHEARLVLEMATAVLIFNDECEKSAKRKMLEEAMSGIAGMMPREFGPINSVIQSSIRQPDPPGTRVTCLPRQAPDWVKDVLSEPVRTFRCIMAPPRGLWRVPGYYSEVAEKIIIDQTGAEIDFTKMPDEQFQKCFEQVDPTPQEKKKE